MRSASLLLAIVAFASVLSAQTKHLVSFQDLDTIKGDALVLKLSPDGNEIAYSSDDSVFYVPTRQGSTPRKVGVGWLPFWSPDGRKIAYYADHSGVTELWIYDLGTRHTAQVTSIAHGIDPDPYTRGMGYFSDAYRMSWSPDGKRLVFASRAPRIVSGEQSHLPVEPWAASKAKGPLVLTETTPPSWTLWGVFAHGFGAGHLMGNGHVSYEPSPEPTNFVSQLFVLDLETKRIRQLTEGNGVYFDPAWSPDGKTIVCSSTHGRFIAQDPAGTDLYLVDATTGKTTALTSGATDRVMPSWSPDGKWVAYLGGAHRGSRHVMVTSIDGETTKAVSPLDRSIDQFEWMPDSRSIVVNYRDGVSYPVAVSDIENGASRIVSGSEPAAQWGVTVSRSGAIAWEMSSPTTLGVIRILRSLDSSPETLVDLDPQVRNWELGDQEVVRWRNHRGDALEGVLLKPVGYQQGKRYPLIVDAYPMQGNYFRANLMTGNQAWASRGYAVFWPNARAPHVWMNGFLSDSYSLAAKGPEGWDVTADDLLSGVDEIIARGVADPERMCLYGFSNGGGIVNYMVTKTDRFKCAVSVAGATADWLRLGFLTPNFNLQDFEGGDDPWSDPEAYVRLSAVFRLENVRTPTLLADGDNDGNFLLDEIEMYEGLRHFRKDVTLLRYPGQGHGFTGPALADFWDRESAFFDKYLK